MLHTLSKLLLPGECEQENQTKNDVEVMRSQLSPLFC